MADLGGQGHLPQGQSNRPEAGGASKAASPPQSRKAQAVSLPQEEYERLVEQAKQFEGYKDRYLRILAEAENARKRLDRDRGEAILYAAERFVKQLLPIVDSFDQALAAIDPLEDQQPTATGVRLIHKQLMELLSKEGVKRIPAIGQPFDPHLHEAIAQVEPTADQADGTIVEEVHVGYTMHGKVVRPALVKVAKRKEQKSEDRGQKPEVRNQKTEGQTQERGLNDG